ncbi:MULTISPECIES: (d)CMP kinase [unclassified Chelatococcus]|uniref:(d)CMP kinase n=1 Tax=unclassified Chelatococcus TaxID=2638111 RepID=UPI001BD19D62|nr:MULTISPECIES: (d)CMP kinase [unclassified Chelatococcus]CAH1661924.1 Cytidylate kinase [Hyphomicrobiales bacterium]MBS7741320.1 (d)CMP kinase [Chelatococcus sp. HY11]MBX3546198.1 (d)CMP kinase [Chelatococcus sp.]MCO5077153.1 (d)CMP kinase [Chelatococcus sp.]CAH1682925.1 Cytidylate kinase [Hyphomicrobiales bacterium]
MILAIDGPAASGKGTLAKRLAAHFNLPHLDTGLLYRGVAMVLLDRGEALTDEDAAERAAQSLSPALLTDSRLRDRAMGEAASVVAAQPRVRAALVAFQRAFAAAPEGAVLDGRDIGTVICPAADVKLFVTAAPEVRARRRALELSNRGEPSDEAEILADIRIRDARDASRTDAPLRAAPDAQVLDTSDLTVDEVFAKALALIAIAIQDCTHTRP